MDDWIHLIRDLGFPIFVAVWLLYQGQRQHAVNEQCLRAINVEIARLSGTLRELIDIIHLSHESSGKRDL